MTAKLPLANVRILITRSSHQADVLSSKLKSLGAVTIELPVIAIGPPESWEQLDSALQDIVSYDWLLFASVNAVEACVFRLNVTGKPIEALKKIRIAAIGPSTATALLRYGLKPDFCPSQFIGEGLVHEFPGYPNLQNLHILWPRTNVGRTYVVDKLREAGATVEVVQSYQTAEPANKEENAHRLQLLLEEHQLDIITLASSQSAKNLADLLHEGLLQKGIAANLHEHSLTALLDGIKLASIGPETSQAIKQRFGHVDIEAKEHTMDGLVCAIVESTTKTTA